MVNTDYDARGVPLARKSFPAIKTALKKQDRDLSRARRRWSALLPPTLRRDAPAGALQAGIEPLRLLQQILDHADVIALAAQEPFEPFAVKQVHILLTLPVRLLDRATAIAAYDAEDEDTDGGDDQQDMEPNECDEPSLGACDATMDQTNWGHEGNGTPSDHVYPWGTDLEFDEGYAEPSLGSIEAIDQTHWSDGNRLDLERGGHNLGPDSDNDLGSDCDDDESSDDEEPDPYEGDWHVVATPAAAASNPRFNLVEPDLPDEAVNPPDIVPELSPTALAKQFSIVGEGIDPNGERRQFALSPRAKEIVA